MNQHIPVMLQEAINALNIKKQGIYLDLTIGRAGHAQAILNKLKKPGMLIGFDKDEQAINESSSILKEKYKNFSLIQSDFKNLKNELLKMKIYKVDGIIADLGVSSPQIDQKERGFSYNKNARLDMRMNQKQTLDASLIVNSWSIDALIEIFKKYGDEKFAKRIAQNIIKNRPINSTLELVEIIRNSLPAAVVRKKHPAKNIFQAIRITVNDEVESLKIMLKDATNLLQKDGRLCIITFNSLEDRIVKKFFGTLIKDDTGKLPIIFEKNYRAKAIKPSKEEINKNKKARSAKLRVLIKE